MPVPASVDTGVTQGDGSLVSRNQREMVPVALTVVKYALQAGIVACQRMGVEIFLEQLFNRGFASHFIWYMLWFYADLGCICIPGRGNCF